jgi:hypothetical protein
MLVTPHSILLGSTVPVRWCFASRRPLGWTNLSCCRGGGGRRCLGCYGAALGGRGRHSGRGRAGCRAAATRAGRRRGAVRCGCRAGPAAALRRRRCRTLARCSSRLQRCVMACAHSRTVVQPEVPWAAVARTAVLVALRRLDLTPGALHVCCMAVQAGCTNALGRTVG